jgi:hypothetical protein
MDYKTNQFRSCRVKLAATTALACIMAGGVAVRMSAYESGHTVKEDH